MTRWPLCVTCQTNPQSSALWITGECDSCYINGRRKASLYREAQEREQRIEEQAEALRRAFPNGLYR